MSAWNVAHFLSALCFYSSWEKRSLKAVAGTVPDIIIPVDNWPSLDSMTSYLDNSKLQQSLILANISKI